VTIVLVNLSERLRSFNLPHETYCAQAGTCVCTVVGDIHPRRVSASLSLAAGTRSEPLLDAVLRVAEVASAVRRGELQAIGVEASAPARPADEPPDGSDDAPRRRRRGGES
jgi:hypothetical protein